MVRRQRGRIEDGVKEPGQSWTTIRQYREQLLIQFAGEPETAVFAALFEHQHNEQSDRVHPANEFKYRFPLLGRNLNGREMPFIVIKGRLFGVESFEKEICTLGISEFVLIGHALLSAFGRLTHQGSQIAAHLSQLAHAPDSHTAHLAEQSPKFPDGRQNVTIATRWRESEVVEINKSFVLWVPRRDWNRCYRREKVLEDYAEH